MKESPYKSVVQAVNFSELEKNIIKKWQKDQDFEKSVKGEKNYIFYDGPPFANGLPHYGHLLTGYIKDSIARYQTMLGKKVERRFGWDCHGLPAEMAAEKELGISGKVAIEEYGIAKFNDYCETSVLRYTSEWQEYVTRQGRWVDFENDYKTMDRNYMESVIWAFKTIYDKGLIYKSYRVMPYSWACQTPVSDFETRMDNCYRQKESKAITVKFPILAEEKLAQQYPRLSLVVWTTTPWTLPSNLAIAVGEDIEYAVIKHGDEHLIIADDLHSKYQKEIGDEVVSKIKGSELLGLKYKPLFDYFADHPGAFSVLSGEFVTTEDGTGIVHIAPGFGEDDQKICEEKGIKLVCPVDDSGQFTSEVSDYQGLQVFEANEPIIIKLKKDNLWLKTEQYLHNYPHCWRTDTPLIYKAVPSWYLEVTKLRDRMVANNEKINWIPSHIKQGLFGKWLANARDWSISRNRFWGCPIPIWQSDDPQYPCTKVFGSIAEMEAAFGKKIPDLHKQYVDELKLPNPEDPTGKSHLVRVPEVLDCWFESGSMPYAQQHYPFENQEKFEQNFPADFIVEYVAQTRGWFYTLMVLSTALFDQPPFLNCICHGVILGDGGQKLSKRLKNYADPMEVFATYGSDALRWYLLSSPVMRGQEIAIDKDGKSIAEAMRFAIKPVWNAYNFFVMYANADNIKAEFDLSSSNLLDRYIISKTLKTVIKIRQGLDEYNTPQACDALSELLEVLNNWYIRRSRQRFWREERDQDKVNAYNTLYSVLCLICRIAAPILPFLTEEIYSNLEASANSVTSVHHAAYPEVDIAQIDENLVEQMERVRDACSAALSIRSDVNVRVRQPLAKVTFIGVASGDMDEELKQLILDEINVKLWHNISGDEITSYANYRLKLHFPVIGKRLAHRMKDIIAANKAGEWSLNKGGKLLICNEELMEEEFDLLLEPKAEYSENLRALSTNDALVLLDLELTDELINEGLARDFVRLVQNLRKEHDFAITDHIKIQYYAKDAKLRSALVAWQGYIADQTLAEELTLLDEKDSEQMPSYDIEDYKVYLLIKKL